ncbi:hypothetical protein B9Z55_027736 [Caenorhabditis nigoni]|uniref:C-type lectin domain-containing protein n=1 Tax=Caenorhabditis nigoni TaxID=1611254 RepID=A0A2G5SEM3_9PELO|nr:hypothetical protein B9Z55_027736 [Caenorhabditis nigoni]
MKFLLLGALLIGATSCQPIHHGYEDLIIKVNYERREYAKFMNISNMYELHWTWNETFNPDTPGARPPGRLSYFQGKDRTALATETHYFAKYYWNKDHHGITTILYPLQKEIRCASREMKYRWGGPYGSRFYDTLCYIELPLEGTDGMLGSGCGTDFNVNGLCRSKNFDFEESSVTTIYMNLLTKLNIERREYAKAMKISNMYKLEWNEALSLVNEEPHSTQTPNFQTYYAGRNRGAYFYEIQARNASNYQWSGDISKWNEQVIEQHESGTLNFLAHLVPEQKAFGCIEKPYVLNSKEINGAKYDLEYDYTCYLGPERSLKNSVWKFGAPGTGCGSDEVEDGLCVGSLPEGYKPFGEFSSKTTSPPITTSSSPPEELKTSPPQAAPEDSLPEELKTLPPIADADQEISSPQEPITPSPHIKAAPEISNQQKYEELLAKLNYDRRELAKAMDVANMFKLVWNDDNAKVAHALSQEQPIENMPVPNYRKFFVGRNKDAIAFEKDITRDFDASSAIELKYRTDDLDDGVVHTLEQFLPTQTEIGCAPFDKVFTFFKFTDDDVEYLDLEYSTICVLTPTSSFKDAVTKSGPAGSECGGCQVEDGLCLQNSEGDKLQCLQ